MLKSCKRCNALRVPSFTAYPCDLAFHAAHTREFDHRNRRSHSPRRMESLARRGKERTMRASLIRWISPASLTPPPLLLPRTLFFHQNRPREDTAGGRSPRKFWSREILGRENHGRGKQFIKGPVPEFHPQPRGRTFLLRCVSSCQQTRVCFMRDQSDKFFLKTPQAPCAARMTFDTACAGASLEKKSVRLYARID